MRRFENASNQQPLECSRKTVQAASSVNSSCLGHKSIYISTTYEGQQVMICCVNAIKDSFAPLLCFTIVCNNTASLLVLPSTCPLQVNTKYSDEQTPNLPSSIAINKINSLQHNAHHVYNTIRRLPSTRPSSSGQTGLCGSASMPKLPTSSASHAHVAREPTMSRRQKSASNATAHDLGRVRFPRYIPPLLDKSFTNDYKDKRLGFSNAQCAPNT
ncbi:hypothetical protein E2P81_ATG11256 [Venturia nashicola]|nr:hypothetical protein E2P81_ATG11256 [Venturia nashicola]